MKKISVNELDFISNLFSDGEVTVAFKEIKGGYYIVTFIPDDDDDDFILDYLYTGDLKVFLSVISEAYIPDYSALCNLSTIAKNALLFIK